jgi:hypothetical protein
MTTQKNQLEILQREVVLQKQQLKDLQAKLEAATPEPSRPSVDYSFAQSKTERMAMDRAIMARSSFADLVRNAGDDEVRAIVAEQRRGITPPSSMVTPNAPAAPVQRGSAGWRDPAPLEVPGLKYVDDLCIAQDARDRLANAARMADTVDALLSATSTAKAAAETGDKKS